MRKPPVQVNSVRRVLSRRLYGDQSPRSTLVNRSWDLVSKASARATQLPEARKDGLAVRSSQINSDLDSPPSQWGDINSRRSHRLCVPSAAMSRKSLRRLEVRAERMPSSQDELPSERATRLRIPPFNPWEGAGRQDKNVTAPLDAMIARHYHR
jgi:hypothetical protein